MQGRKIGKLDEWKDSMEYGIVIVRLFTLFFYPLLMMTVTKIPTPCVSFSSIILDPPGFVGDFLAFLLSFWFNPH